MKKSPNDLFFLIQSMSKEERSFFRRNAKSNSGLLMLFNSIDKMEQYDEAKLKAAVSDHIRPNSFAREKSYLYDKIVEYMGMYQINNSIREQVIGKILGIRYLFDKGLISQCANLLNKTKKIAEQYELNNELLLLTKIEGKIIFRSRNPEQISRKAKDLFDQQQYLLKLISNQIEFDDLDLRIQVPLNKYIKAIGHIQQLEYDQIFNSSLMRTEAKALSFEAKITYYLLKTVQFHVTEKTHLSYDRNLQLLRLFESGNNRHFISLFPDKYIACLGNSLLALGKKKDLKDFYINLDKLRNFNCNDTKLNKAARLSSFLYEMHTYIQRAMFPSAKKLLQTMGTEYQNVAHEFRRAELMTIYFINAEVYYALEENNKAIDFIEKLINFGTKEKSRQDLIASAHLLGLMIRFDIKVRHDHLEQYIRRAERYLAGRKFKTSVESAIIRLYKKAWKNPGNFDEYILEFKQQFEQEIKNNPKEKIIMAGFDLKSWIESKIQNRKFADVALEKINNQLSKKSITGYPLLG